MSRSSCRTCPPRIWPNDYDLIANGVVDSLGLLRLIGWLETRFEIPIDDIEIAEKDFVTVDAICEFIEREARPSVSLADTAAKEG